ncbi:MAG: TetR/AcrR family transcriptional regulator [Bacteroidetes bacterium]|nr:TetR/AcrR family transcriptional regulator [Bacteroidota bacterium]MBS1934362.1 TetR/AcrR family transcriptional regulator [Bacteroidota bacterium]
MAADKREHILAVAEKLFGDKGFDGTSVRDIAQHANVNLAMISYYFGSKEKLLEALLEQRANYTILEALNKDESLTPWEKIDKVIDFYVDKIMNNLCIHNIMQQANRSSTPGIKELTTKIKLRNFEQIKKIVLDGQKKKLFRKVDIEMTVGTVMGTISQVTLARHFYNVLFNIEDGNDEAYRKKMGPKLKSHLKQLLHAHLDIKNEE